MWLIFALVIFWTAFPAAFAAVMTARALPLWLAVLGIVLRGAGFAFRKEVAGPALAAPARRHVRAVLAADAVLHGHRDRRGGGGKVALDAEHIDAGRVDRPDLAADRRAVRRGVRLSGGRST